MEIRLAALYVYPIKSMRGVAVPSARLDRWGLQHDRRYMLVDANGRFLTQRLHPRMALIQPHPMENGWMLNAPGMPSLRLPLHPEGQPCRVTVWDDECDALVLDATYAAWFSQFLAVPSRLVYFPDSAQRQVDLSYASPGTQTSFSDGFPLLLANRASLDALNKAMPQPVEMLRFRPNLVVSGAVEFDEDNWQQIKVGDVMIDVVKPCSRCVIPSIDFETGQRGQQPILDVLKQQRRKPDGKVYFGQNLIHREEGVLRVGDQVELILSVSE
ncbi:MAG TPA: MOSC domain-containing protein [Pseudomonadales bacterium]|nr:MOSC domain-containing protein [Pseudomonadales bacterium]